MFSTFIKIIFFILCILLAKMFLKFTTYKTFSELKGFLIKRYINLRPTEIIFLIKGFIIIIFNFISKHI
jgi:hypothetical protein